MYTSSILYISNILSTDYVTFESPSVSETFLLLHNLNVTSVEDYLEKVIKEESDKAKKETEDKAKKEIKDKAKKEIENEIEEETEEEAKKETEKETEEVTEKETEEEESKKEIKDKAKKFINSIAYDEELNNLNENDLTNKNLPQIITDLMDVIKKQENAEDKNLISSLDKELQEINSLSINNLI